MPLPLPYIITTDAGVQGNFQEVAKQFPISRRNLAVEAPHIVGSAGEPAFQHGWANFVGLYQGARFWKGPDGIVHVEGHVALGTIGQSIFTLPAGYLPAARMSFMQSASGVTFSFTRVDVLPDGTIIVVLGANDFVPINLSFKQEN